MQKFCKKCGQKLDEKTGLCPNCSKSMSGKEKRTAKKDYKKAIKKEKKAKLTIGQKIKRVCLRLLIIVFVLLLLASGTMSILVYLGIVNIPVVENVIEVIFDRSDPAFSAQASEGCYIPNEENIVYENDNKSLGYVNNMVLVFFRKDASTDDINNIAKAINGKIVGKIDGLNQYQIQVKPADKSELQKICDDLLANDIVKDAIIDVVVTTTVNSIPNDPWRDTFQGSFGVDWDESNPSGTNWWIEATNVISAWEYSRYFSGIRVGIVDNGFDTSHEDLSISVLNNSLNSSENHGTHVAGVIGATINNNKGISGILDNVSLYGVDFYATSKQKKNNITVSSLYDGINQCIQNECKVINMSSGVKYTNKEETKKVSSEMAHNAVVCLIYLLDSYDTDFLVVQSAGNGDNWSNGLNAKEYNGWFSGIDKQLVENVFAEYSQKGAKTEKSITVQDVMDSFMVVAAVDDTKKRGDYQLAKFSNYGNTITVCAPGVNVFSTIKTGGIDGSYGYMDGTSMASPIVAGITALTWSVDQSMSSGAVKKIITDTATKKVLSRQWSDKSTYYMIDAAAAVQAAIKTKIGKNDSSRTGSSVRTTSDERDIVLVLDVSGSMSGKPMEETKKASSNFINTILKENASIGIVTYDSSASMLSDFSVDEQSLTSIANSITDGGGTNIESGLMKAKEMLAASNAKKRIIVLMSDGEPNEGKVGDELISYADSIKAEGTYIYTLGFFKSMASGKSDAQVLMEKIASDGCHYEVADADDLKFFFGDIADQINGQKYIYVRIACPVDVTVTYNGETLRSDQDNTNERTSFGSLTFEENKSESGSDTDNRIKILRLKEGTDYDVQIEGNGTGKMNYTIGFMDESGKYSDMRKFSNLEISPQTQIDTVASNTSATMLNVDSDGDGKYDLKYKAKANSEGKIVDYSYIRYIVYIVGVLIILLILYTQIKKWRRKSAERAIKKKSMQKRFCMHCGNVVLGDKNFCPKCGNKME